MSDEDLIIIKKGDFNVSLVLKCGVCGIGAKSLTLVAPGEYDSVEFRICMLDEVLKLNDYFFMCYDCLSLVLRCTTSLGIMHYTRSLSEFKPVRECFLCGTAKATHEFRRRHDIASLMVLQRMNQQYNFRTELVHKICYTCDELYKDLAALYNIVRVNPKYRGDMIASEPKERLGDEKKYEDSTKQMLAKLRFSPKDKNRSKLFPLKKKKRGSKDLSSTTCNNKHRKKQLNRTVATPLPNATTIKRKLLHPSFTETVPNQNKTANFVSKDNCSKQVHTYFVNDKNKCGYESEAESIPEELEPTVDIPVEIKSTGKLSTINKEAAKPATAQPTENQLSYTRETTTKKQKKLTNMLEIIQKNSIPRPEEPKQNESININIKKGKSRIPITNKGNEAKRMLPLETSLETTKKNSENVKNIATSDEKQKNIKPVSEEFSSIAKNNTDIKGEDNSLKIVDNKTSNVRNKFEELKLDNKMLPYVLKPNTPVLLKDIPNEPRKKKYKPKKLIKSENNLDKKKTHLSSLLLDNADDKECNAEMVAEKLAPHIKFIAKLFTERVSSCGNVIDKRDVATELLENFVRQINVNAGSPQNAPQETGFNSSHMSLKVKNLMDQLRPQFKTISSVVSRYNYNSTRAKQDSKRQVLQQQASLDLPPENEYISEKLESKKSITKIENVKAEMPIAQSQAENSRNTILDLLQTFQSKNANNVQASLDLPPENEYISEKLEPKKSITKIENVKAEMPIAQSQAEKSRNTLLDLLQTFQSKNANNVSSEKNNLLCQAASQQSEDKDNDNLFTIQPHFQQNFTEIQTTENNELDDKDNDNLFTLQTFQSNNANNVSSEKNNLLCPAASQQSEDKDNDNLFTIQPHFQQNFTEIQTTEYNELDDDASTQPKNLVKSKNVVKKKQPEPKRLREDLELRSKSYSIEKKKIQYQHDKKEEEGVRPGTACIKTYHDRNTAQNSFLSSRQALSKTKQANLDTVRKLLADISALKKRTEKQNNLQQFKKNPDSSTTRFTSSNIPITSQQQKSLRSSNRPQSRASKNDTMYHEPKPLMNRGDEILEELEDESDLIMRKLPVNCNNQENDDEVESASIARGIDNYPLKLKTTESKNTYKKCSQNDRQYSNTNTGLKNKGDIASNTCMHFPTKQKTVKEIYGTPLTASKGKKKNSWVPSAKERPFNFPSRESLMTDAKVVSYLNKIPYSSNKIIIPTESIKDPSSQELVPRRDLSARLKYSDSDVTSYPNKSCSSIADCSTVRTFTTSDTSRKSVLPKQAYSSKIRDLAKIYNVDINKLRPTTAVPSGMRRRNQKNGQF